MGIIAQGDDGSLSRFSSKAESEGDEIEELRGQVRFYKQALTRKDDELEVSYQDIYHY